MKKTHLLHSLRIDKGIHDFIIKMKLDIEAQLQKNITLAQLRRCFYLCIMRDKKHYKCVVNQAKKMLKYVP